MYADDAVQAALIDEVLEALEDVTADVYSVIQEKDAVKKVLNILKNNRSDPHFN